MKAHCWKLWLDDQVSDPNTPNRWPPDGWVAADSVQEAMEKFELFGHPPEEVSLDHDLGEDQPSGMKLLYWWVENYFRLPPRICRIHSANPVGRDNMRSFVQNWRRELEEMSQPIKVRGQLRHHFWGTYHATIGLFCQDEAEAQEVSQRIGSPWKVSEKKATAVVYHGKGDELEAQFAKLAELGADMKKVKSMRFSVDFGEKFEVTV